MAKLALVNNKVTQCNKNHQTSRINDKMQTKLIFPLMARPPQSLQIYPQVKRKIFKATKMIQIKKLTKLISLDQQQTPRNKAVTTCKIAPANHILIQRCPCSTRAQNLLSPYFPPPIVDYITTTNHICDGLSKTTFLEKKTDCTACHARVKMSSQNCIT